MIEIRPAKSQQASFSTDANINGVPPEKPGLLPGPALVIPGYSESGLKKPDEVSGLAIGHVSF